MKFVAWVFASTALAYSIQGFVPGLDQKEVLSTTLHLENLETHNFDHQYLTAGGNFTFRDVDDGTYLVSLTSPYIQLGYRYRLIIMNGGLQVNRLYQGHALTDVSPEADYPLQVDDYQRIQTVVPRPQFSVWAMVKQPTVYMSLITMLMIFALPYLTIDEEDLAAEEAALAAAVAQKGQKKTVKAD